MSSPTQTPTKYGHIARVCKASYIWGTLQCDAMCGIEVYGVVKYGVMQDQRDMEDLETDKISGIL